MNRSIRIAVADDEPDLRDFLQKMLTRLGHEVVAVAENGRELLDVFQTTQPELVVTDIKMPEMDGLEAIAHMHKQRPVPVIVVSAFFDEETIERAEAGQVHAYLVKPIKQSHLLPAIAIAMRRFEELQSLREALAQIKQLHGLLPICVYCKRIRDDSHYWERLERYIEKHTEARFSHGICPGCYRSVVQPELDQRMKKQQPGNPDE